MTWPAVPPRPGQELLSLLFQFEQTQWWHPQRLEAMQFRQLRGVLRFARRQVPYYQRRLAQLERIGKLDWELWRQLPLLTRADIQEADQSLIAKTTPKGHGRMIDITTSGSSGSPVRVKGNRVTGLFFRALNVRNHLWHRRDFQGLFCSIRFLKSGGAKAPDGRDSTYWSFVFPTAPSAVLNVFSSLDEQLDWLQRKQPAYLLTYPSNLEHLIRRMQERELELPTLRDAGTFGEAVGVPLRELCRESLGVPLIDMYSSMEFGMLALQCPLHEHYHVQSENVLLEVLNDFDQPCQPGEVGRVVATCLNNFATPLIRYDIGDLAEVGEPCDCGRGLPVLKRVIGRVRNMLVMPDGSKRWPGVFISNLRDVVPVRQMQFVQQTVHDLLVRLVVPRAVTAEEEEALRQRVGEMLGEHFGITFEYLDHIPRLPGGKYADFICEV